jgi:hypothetical protein
MSKAQPKLTILVSSIQKFRSTEDGSLFVGAQFFRYPKKENGKR